MARRPQKGYSVLYGAAQFRQIFYISGIPRYSVRRDFGSCFALGKRPLLDLLDYQDFFDSKRFCHRHRLAWSGSGERCGYYSNSHNCFNRLGLPDDPEWLDLTHTWITGVPIHFAVIYIGYLVALWMWRKSDAGDIDYVGARPLVNSALIAALIVVILSGLLGSWALGQFVGATWFVTRLLIVFMFFLFCFAYIPQSGSGIVMGSLTLALILTAYSHYLGPLGLPGEWRLFENFTPHTEPYWLNYQELWLKQFPIYLITSMLGLWAVKFRISKILGKL
jgi:hypothetical protein